MSLHLWRAAGALVLCAGVFGAGWAANGWRLGGRVQQLQADHAKQREGQATALAGASEAARAEEQRRNRRTEGNC
ncbi:hypothetical protein [Cupriavidus alkaliphilus]|uniref:hypothetical protein n=1 Tax=Cupriavidus alkaliphilus TaxID=942866 RepID=UPI00182A558C|nr:hypothetical protein [Cupriavidus alkaliphilus]MBB2918190.1 hypothetical protein [Cupriavidus alkaliphilus]